MAAIPDSVGSRTERLISSISMLIDVRRGRICPHAASIGVLVVVIDTLMIAVRVA